VAISKARRKEAPFKWVKATTRLSAKVDLPDAVGSLTGEEGSLDDGGGGEGGEDEGGKHGR
jgi:hypothetical protein